MILDEIKNASVFSIILDTTPDITRVDQLSVVFRYVKVIIDNIGKPADLKVNESFVGLFPVREHTASGIKDLIFKYFEEHGTDMKNAEGKLMTVRV